MCALKFKSNVCQLTYIYAIVYSYFHLPRLTLSTLFGISSEKPKADYYPFFALMLRWKRLGPLWPGTILFGMCLVDPSESTGGDAPAAAAAAAPAAPGTELMSGKTSEMWGATLHAGGHMDMLQISISSQHIVR